MHEKGDQDQQKRKQNKAGPGGSRKNKNKCSKDSPDPVYIFNNLGQAANSLLTDITKMLCYFRRRMFIRDFILFSSALLMLGAATYLYISVFDLLDRMYLTNVLTAVPAVKGE